MSSLLRLYIALDDWLTELEEICKALADNMINDFWHCKLYWVQRDFLHLAPSVCFLLIWLLVSLKCFWVLPILTSQSCCVIKSGITICLYIIKETKYTCALFCLLTGVLCNKNIKSQDMSDVWERPYAAYSPQWVMFMSWYCTCLCFALLLVTVLSCT